MTATAATRWVGVGVPRWVPKIGLTTLWGLAFVAAVLSDNQPCTPTDPSVCGPDPVSSWVIVGCLATPVLLLWMPLVGCVAGVAFAVAELASDDLLGARISFGAHGAVCAAVAVWMVHAAARQRQAAARSAGGLTVAAPPLPPGTDPRGGWNVVRLGVTGLLLVGGVGLLGWYGHEVDVERAHITRAVEVPATIVSVDDEDISVTLQARGPDGTTRRAAMGVLETTPYREGASTPLLLDPADPDWARLVAEPYDATGWQVAGLGALLLALLLAARELGARRARQQLWTGQHPALRVRAIPDDDGNALVLPAEDGSDPPDPQHDVPVAWLPVAGQQPLELSASASLERAVDPDADGWDAATRASFGRAWRGEDDGDLEPFDLSPAQPEPAVLLGNLHDRGWALLVTAEGVLVPSEPLRVGHIRTDDTPWSTRLLAKLPPVLAKLPLGRWRDRIPALGDDSPTPEEDAQPLPGQPVSADALRQEPELPMVAWAPARQRALGALMVVAGLIGAPAVLLLLDVDWFGRGITVLFGGQILVAGVGQALQRLRLTRTQLEIVRAMRSHAVPWDQLYGVRRDGPTLVLAWEPDIITGIGPFDEAGGSLGQEDRAEQLGAAMLVLRARALAAGTPGRATRSRLGPAWVILAVYAVVMAAAAWLVISR